MLVKTYLLWRSPRIQAMTPRRQSRSGWPCNTFKVACVGDLEAEARSSQRGKSGASQGRLRSLTTAPTYSCLTVTGSAVSRGQPRTSRQKDWPTTSSCCSHATEFAGLNSGGPAHSEGVRRERDHCPRAVRRELDPARNHRVQYLTCGRRANGISLEVGEADG